MVRSSRRIRVVLALLAFLAAAIAWWWTHPPDPVRTLRTRWSPLLRVERVPMPELGEGVERWRIVDARGDTTLALWRRASAVATRPWTGVLLGGFHTGDRAALVIPPAAMANVLAVDWPWRESRSLSPWQIAGRLGRVREAELRSPAVLALAVEGAATQPEVDTSRVALLGVSLGAPVAIAALRMTRTPDALVLIDGSANLEAMLRAELVRAVRPRWLAWPLAALGYRLGRPLEPLLNTQVAASLPVLLVNARDDELMPRAGVEALRAALPGATVVERPGKHVRPEDREGLADLAATVVAWLDRLPAPTDTTGLRRAASRAKTSAP